MLESLHKRFNLHPEQREEYEKFLREYKQLGHMQEATVSSRSNSHIVYIPHHAVFRQGNTTIPLRVVFNASSLTTNGTSHMLTGPKLQNDMSSYIKMASTPLCLYSRYF